MKLKVELKSHSILKNLRGNIYPSTRYQKNITSVVYVLNSLKNDYKEFTNAYVSSCYIYSKPMFTLPCFMHVILHTCFLPVQNVEFPYISSDLKYNLYLLPLNCEDYNKFVGSDFSLQ